MLTVMTLGSLTMPRRAVATKLTEIIVDTNSDGPTPIHIEDSTRRTVSSRDELRAVISNLTRSESATDKRYLELAMVVAKKEMVHPALQKASMSSLSSMSELHE